MKEKLFQAVIRANLTLNIKSAQILIDFHAFLSRVASNAKGAIASVPISPLPAQKTENLPD